MAVNFCSNCGAKLRQGAKFCGSCGQKIFTQTPTTSPPPPQKNLLEHYSEVKASAPKIELQKPAPKSMAQIYAEAKANAQAEQKHSPPAPPVLASVYREDVTIKEKFFTSTGRLNRWRYFVRSIWLWVPIIILAFMFLGSASNGSAHSDTSGGLLIIICVYSLVSIVPNIMLTIRRLHDLDKSGWFYLILMIPYVNFIFALYVIFAPGTVGPNKYGPDPLENEHR